MRLWKENDEKEREEIMVVNILFGVAIFIIFCMIMSAHSQIEQIRHEKELSFKDVNYQTRERFAQIENKYECLTKRYYEVIDKARELEYAQKRIEEDYRKEQENG